MSRYIDAEWLIKESMPLDFSVQKWVNEVQIMTAPSIDICFCRECKWWRTKYFKDGHGWCEYHINETVADDFCSYGSRKERVDD